MINTNFFGKREECVRKIQNSINMYSKKELSNLLPRSELLSIVRRVKHLITGAKVDAQGNIHFSDEFDPDKLTDYIMSMKEYACARELVYECVCRYMVPTINEFYSDLNSEGVTMRSYGVTSYSCTSMEDYAKAFEARKAFPHKRLRGKA